MPNDFTLGTMGVATGSASNAAGLMFAAERPASGPLGPSKAPACPVGQVRWHADSHHCFAPTQLHINILTTSVLLNAALLIVLFVYLLPKARRQ